MKHKKKVEVKHKRAEIKHEEKIDFAHTSSVQKHSGTKFWKTIIILVALVILLVLIGLVFLAFFYTPKCESKECFYNNLADCKKSLYIFDKEETIMQYTIEKEKEKKCYIDVKLLQVKKGEANLASLEGSNMLCTTSTEAVTMPEENIENCHGLLKEQIQDLIIKKMYSQVIERLGEISNLTKVI